MIGFLLGAVVMAVALELGHRRAIRTLRAEQAPIVRENDWLRQQLKLAHHHLRDYDRRVAEYLADRQVGRIVLDVVERTRSRIMHARAMVFRDWAKVDVALGMAERDLSRALQDHGREDVLLTAEDPLPHEVATSLAKERTEQRPQSLVDSILFRDLERRDSARPGGHS